jgi:hypothetical protein
MHSFLVGAIVGFITSTGTGEPLPFADVTIGQHKTRALSDERGRFQWTNAPAGRVTLLVRRIGYTPATVQVTVVDGRTDTVRVSLTPMSLRLEAVRKSEPQCGGQTGSDTAVVRILQQVQLNAERYRLLTRDFPFVTSMERTIADELVSAAVVGVRRQQHNVRIDTISLSDENARPYEPGKLIAKAAGDAENKVHGHLLIPTLPDFADSAFVAVHCFQYAGVESDGDARRIRVDLTPVRSLREPDVSGSLFMDPSTFQITRSVLELNVPAPSGSGDVWEVRIDTRFQEILPGIAIIANVCERATTTSNTQTARVEGRAVRLGPSTVEMQRVLAVEFIDESPDLQARKRTLAPRMTACE